MLNCQRGIKNEKSNSYRPKMLNRLLKWYRCRILTLYTLESSAKDEDYFYIILYNNPSYSRILIGSRL